MLSKYIVIFFYSLFYKTILSHNTEVITIKIQWCTMAFH